MLRRLQQQREAFERGLRFERMVVDGVPVVTMTDIYGITRRVPDDNPRLVRWLKTGKRLPERVLSRHAVSEEI